MLAQDKVYGPSARKFKLLLDRGADIKARDHFGRNCLHMAVMTAGRPIEGDREMEAISLLIQRGADIFNVDNSGCSIFDTAYACDHDCISFLGGYRGDLWDAALSRCGYGEYIRKPEERVRHYTAHYTENDFRSLWKGREHLRPYFSEETGSLCPDWRYTWFG